MINLYNAPFLFATGKKFENLTQINTCKIYFLLMLKYGNQFLSWQLKKKSPYQSPLRTLLQKFPAFCGITAIRIRNRTLYRASKIQHTVFMFVHVYFPMTYVSIRLQSTRMYPKWLLNFTHRHPHTYAMLMLRRSGASVILHKTK